MTRSSQRINGMIVAGVFAIAASACSSGSQPAPTAPSGAGSPTPSVPGSPGSGAVGPTGSYALTLTASPSCDALGFPEVVRTRRYDAEFAGGAAVLTAADGTGNKVNIGGIDHYIYYGMPLMTMSGNELKIIVPPADGGGYIAASPTCAGGDYWWEELSATAGGREVFESCGTWVGSVQPSGNIEGTISGSFGYYKGQGPNWSTDLFCRAGDHRFSLTKR